MAAAALGMQEMALIVETLAACGGGSTVGQLFMINPIFGGVSIARFGSEAMKSELLPKIISGEINCCMALTEPDAGSNSLEIKTFAEPRRQRLATERPQDLDHRRRRGAEDAGGGAHHQSAGGQAPHRRPFACSSSTSRARGSLSRRSRRSAPTRCPPAACSSRTCTSTAASLSARSTRAGTNSSTCSTPSASSPPRASSERARWRCARRSPTRTSGVCSATSRSRCIRAFSFRCRSPSPSSNARG